MKLPLLQHRYSHGLPVSAEWVPIQVPVRAVQVSVQITYACSVLVLVQIT